MESEYWEDIYGRTRDKKGNVIKDEVETNQNSQNVQKGPSKYIPPALRGKVGGTEDEKKRLARERLKKQVKGLKESAEMKEVEIIQTDKSKKIPSIFGEISWQLIVLPKVLTRDESPLLNMKTKELNKSLSRLVSED